MKSPLIIYPAMLALLFTACDEKKADATEEGIEAQNDLSGALHENQDTAPRDGTLIQGALDQMDSVHLPDVVDNKIKKDAILSQEPITAVKRITEGGVDYYEVRFLSKDGSIKTLVYDEKGTVKSSN
jgi:hypothetical protein